MKKIITILLISVLLIGCSPKTNTNINTFYEDKGITFSLPSNYYLDDDGIYIVNFEDGKLNTIGHMHLKEYDSEEDYQKSRKESDSRLGEYIDELDAYYLRNSIGSSIYDGYSFFNDDRLNWLQISFVDQDEEIVNTIIKTIDVNAEIKENEKTTIDYFFSNEWNDYKYNSFNMSLPNNIYLSDISGATDIFIRQDNNFKRIGILYLDEFTEKVFDYYKDVSPSGSRIQLADNIYKDDSVRSIYSLINYDKRTISNIEFFIDIDNDFEKQFIDSISFNK